MLWQEDVRVPVFEQTVQAGYAILLKLGFLYTWEKLQSGTRKYNYIKTRTEKMGEAIKLTQMTFIIGCNPLS